jgi:GntR family transcriptional regulator
MQWNNNSPIYLQIKEKIIAAIIDQAMLEGDAIPSIRQISADYQINPITVSKAYQLLVENGILEKRRGLGMFVMEGARKQLLHEQKQQFLLDEWPELKAKIKRLGLSLEELV